MNNNLEVFVTINGVDNFTKINEKAKQSTKSFEEKHKNSSEKIVKNNKKVKSSFEKISKALKGFLALGFFKSAFTNFAYMDKYIKKTQGVLHENESGMKDYVASIKGLSKDSANSMNDLFQVGFLGAKSGFKKEELKEFVKLTDDMQIAISGLAEESVQSVATGFAIISKSFKSVPIKDVGDQFAYLIDNTEGLDIHEFTMGLQKLNMTARSTKASFIGLAPAVATLIKSGSSGAIASTKIAGITKAFEKLGNKSVAKKLGLKEATLEGEGFNKLIGDLSIKLNGMSQEKKTKILSKVFGNEGSLTVMSLINNIDSLNSSIDMATNKSKGFVEHMAKTQKEGAYGSYKKAVNQLSLAMSNIGEGLADSGVIDFFVELLNLLNGILGILKPIIGVFSRFTGILSATVKGISGGIQAMVDPDKKFADVEKTYNEDIAKLDEKRKRKKELKEKENLSPTIKKRMILVNSANKDLKEIQDSFKNKNNENLVKDTQNNLTQASSQNTSNINISLTNKSGTPLNVEKTETKQTGNLKLVKQDIRNR